MNVARAERRNRKITATTNSTDRISVSCTSRTEARIVSVRSVTMLRWMPPGIARSSRGSAAFTSATASTMFAPGWRWMSSTAAGWLPSRRTSQAATRSFSTPPITLPTADSRTGALLRQAITRF